MLILLCVAIALIAAKIKKKKISKIEFSYALIFIIMFIILDEMKMIFMHQFPMFSKFLFVYVILQYLLLMMAALKYIYKLPTIIFAFGGLLNFAVMTSNMSKIPVAAAVENMKLMQMFTGWIKAGDTGYFIMNTRTTLWFVSDIIPVPMFNTGLLSPGDILIAVGISLLIYTMIPSDTKERRARHARKKTPET